MQRICEYCSEPFEARRSDAKTCSQEHRNKLKQKRKRLAVVPGGGDEPESIIEDDYKRPNPSNGDPLPFGLHSYVEDLLEKHERENVPQARLALVVARRLDIPGLETGAGIVSLSKELDRLLSVALAGVNVESDELDELQKRRRAKAAQA